MKNDSRALTVFSLVTFFAVFLFGCSDEAKKETAALKVRLEAVSAKKGSLEIDLAKSSTELEGLRTQLAEAKKKDDALAQKLNVETAEGARLRTELSAAKERLLVMAGTTELLKMRVAEATAKEQAERNKPAIDFQASVSLKNGDTKPIANTEFYFLKRSLWTIMGETGARGWMDNETGTYRGMAFSLTSPIASDGKNIPQLRDAIAKAAELSFTTNMNGMANPEIPPGKYWVLGFTRVGDANNTILWDYQVTIVGGKNEVHLSQNNSAYP